MIKLNYGLEGREKMTVLINMLGSPSSGKTSLSASLFALMKAWELNVEYTNEYVKSWAWEGRKIGPFDQFYIFGKETHNQSRLFGKVDFIISDSPVMLTAFYHYFYNGNEALNDVCHNFYNLADEVGVQVLNFFLPRKKEYNKKGRFQTEEEADAVAFQLKEWLNKEGYEYEELTCEDSERLNFVFNRLKEIGVLDGKILGLCN